MRHAVSRGTGLAGRLAASPGRLGADRHQQALGSQDDKVWRISQLFERPLKGVGKKAAADKAHALLGLVAGCLQKGFFECAGDFVYLQRSAVLTQQGGRHLRGNAVGQCLGLSLILLQVEHAAISLAVEQKTPRLRGYVCALCRPESFAASRREIHGWSSGARPGQGGACI